MKNKILKLVFGTIIVSLFAFNMIFSFKLDKSETTLSSLLITAQANAEGYDECQWEIYMGGCGSYFLFCGYEDNNWAAACTCGSFQGGC